MESRLTAIGMRRGLEVEGQRKKGKVLMDMDNSTDIAGGGYKMGLNSKRKNTIKKCFKKYLNYKVGLKINLT